MAGSFKCFMFNDLLGIDLKDIIIFLVILMKPLKYKKNRLMETWPNKKLKSPGMGSQLLLNEIFEGKWL